MSCDANSKERFYHYRGKCFEEHVEKYNYKLCMFEKVTQDSTDLGRWGIEMILFHTVEFLL